MTSRDAQSDNFLNSDAINDDFFIDIVERKLKIARDKFKLRLVFIAPATGKNENYVSVVYRAKINIEILETSERKMVNVIIKALLTTVEQMKEFAVFEREILMYQDLIESFEKLWVDVTGKEVGFGPKCIKIASKPYEIIVLDDLKSEGFEMLNRKVGINLDQAKLALAKLAKFHAAGAIRFEKDGMISDHLDRLSILKSPAMNNPEQQQKSTIVFTSILKLFVEAIEHCGYPEIAKKVAQWDMMKIMTIFMAVADPMPCGFRTLVHGDSWLNNMLFQIDENEKSLDMKFIDFQLSFWASPVNDLLYMMSSSLRDDIKVEHFDDLIVFYHDHLVESLQALKYEKHIPTLAELQIDLLEKGGSLGFYLMFILFVVKFDANGEFNIENMMDPEKFDEETMRGGFMNDFYQKALKVWLPFLNKRGFLDKLLPNDPLSPFMASLFEQMQQAAQQPASDEPPAKVECAEI